jgi:IMP dehydrogenase/GMP reductase
MRLLGKALTFDDVLLVPAYFEGVARDTSAWPPACPATSR